MVNAGSVPPTGSGSKGIGRYWRVFRTFFVTSFTRELEYRANFIAKILQNLTWVVFFLLILLVIFGNAKTVGGWNRDESFVLSATIFLMNSICSAFFFSLVEIPQHVRQGTLDFIITKPIDSQFWISTRKFNFNEIGSMLASVGLLAVAVPALKSTPSALQWLAYFVGIACSVGLFYSFNLTLMTLGIWLVRVDNLWVLGESINGIARYPMEIYGVGAQRVLTYFLPLAFLAYVPAEQLVRGFNPSTMGIGIAWTTAALVGSRMFWRYALKSYSSASS